MIVVCDTVPKSSYFNEYGTKFTAEGAEGAELSMSEF